MADVDVGKLSFAELVALKAQLDKEIEGKRGEELKVLADGYVKKLQHAGFTVSEGIDALRPYEETKHAGKGRGSNAGSTAAVLYQDPSNPSNTWSGRGRAARWLADYEAAGRHRDEFKVSST
ncbi:H-NS histone family protein [Paucibacter sp. R3-3]|uniref:H-NS histone family protein n=1 Tax=Roseateles agri TaxID=3098619 RepID=A0ABU5DJS2_9BURK|nr:H-NS histone family protein [Paucibacter sp. R3-3]MDY0746537.1 H-NS histone family protein [Paucibacter sp. R3-3]